MANPNSVKKQNKKKTESVIFCVLSYEDIKLLKKKSKELDKSDMEIKVQVDDFPGANSSQVKNESLTYAQLKEIKKFSKENDKSNVYLKFSRNSGIGLAIQAVIGHLTLDVTDYDRW